MPLSCLTYSWNVMKIVILVDLVTTHSTLAVNVTILLIFELILLIGNYRWRTLNGLPLCCFVICNTCRFYSLAIGVLTSNIETGGTNSAFITVTVLIPFTRIWWPPVFFVIPILNYMIRCCLVFGQHSIYISRAK